MTAPCASTRCQRSYALRTALFKLSEPPKSHIDANLRVSLPERPRVRAVLPLDRQRPKPRAACPVCGADGRARSCRSARAGVQGLGFYLTDYGKNAHQKTGADATRSPTARRRRARSAERRRSREERCGSSPSRRRVRVEAANREVRATPSPPSRSRLHATEAELRRVSTDVELLRAELTRAAASLGAPDGVEPVLERPRDPAFGDWATNLAMVLAKPLGQKPRDLAQRADRGDRSRRGGDLVGRGRRAGLHQLPDGRGARRAGDRRASSPRTRDYGRSDAGKGRARRRGVRVARIPPGRCTSATAVRRRSATRSRRCSSGPGGTSRASSTTTTPACRSRTSR